MDRSKGSHSPSQSDSCGDLYFLGERPTLLQERSDPEQHNLSSYKPPSANRNLDLSQCSERIRNVVTGIRKLKDSLWEFRQANRRFNFLNTTWEFESGSSNISMKSVDSLINKLESQLAEKLTYRDQLLQKILEQGEEIPSPTLPMSFKPSDLRFHGIDPPLIPADPEQHNECSYAPPSCTSDQEISQCSKLTQQYIGKIRQISEGLWNYRQSTRQMRTSRTSIRTTEVVSESSSSRSGPPDSMIDLMIKKLETKLADKIRYKEQLLQGMESQRTESATSPQPHTVIPGDKVKMSENTDDMCVDELGQLRRLLCVSALKSTDNVSLSPTSAESHCIQKLIDANRGKEVVETLKDFSINGRVNQHEPILRALAVCVRSTDKATKSAAYDAVSDICRIPTDLFLFVKAVVEQASLSKSPNNPDKPPTGWGRGLRKAVCTWYSSKSPETLALFVTKYRQRLSWSHKDLLKLCHINPVQQSPEIALVLMYAAQGWKKTQEKYAGDDSMSSSQKNLFEYLRDVEEVKAMKEDVHFVARMIEKHKLVREHVPTWMLKEKKVWRALVDTMPIGAMLRSLSKLSMMGLLDSDAEGNCVEKVTDQLKNTKRLQDARVHPLSVLLALESYKKGKSNTKKKTWIPNLEILDTLQNNTFYSTFEHVEPTKKRHLLCIDASKSMDYGSVHGSPQLKPGQAVAAMAMVTVRTEPNYKTLAFSEHGLIPVSITPEDSLEQVKHALSEIEMGGTDCAAPMLWALEQKEAFDVFIVFTDCDTFQGATLPSDALGKYRKEMAIPDARLIVCALTQTKLSMADAQDAGMLGIVGFTADSPHVIRNFTLGKLQ